MRKPNYSAPELDVQSIVVESGIAVSGGILLDGTTNDQINDYENWDGQWQ
ncbi:MAG: hypothetical protein IKJ02_05420 [Tidjanibacter sp.]|nr:hypothetical protein [Tidjanibacter sp.]